MNLRRLVEVARVRSVRGPTDREITGLAYDSRQVKPGYLFAALGGSRENGRKYIVEAVTRGAVAVLSDRPEPVPERVTLIEADSPRQALAEMACAFYEYPSRQLRLVGVTGTNGKTTVTFMVRDIFRAAGWKPGLIGTVRYEIGERSVPASRTTPEAPDLQAMLSEMVRAGCQSAVMEVSSHGLDQKRVWGTDFDVAVFTNLTRDHLDYHLTMERYFAAKRLFFQDLAFSRKQAWAVTNLDDPWGRRLKEGEAARWITFGWDPAADVVAEDVQLGESGARFTVRSPWGRVSVRLPLLGRFNVSNALAAFAACGALGIAPEIMAEALAHVAAVPGRLEPIPNSLGLHVMVDYAHTPDALSNVLRTVRELSKGRVIVVFGCGGDRDRGKRPLMGAAAASLADWVVLTSDNPRSEDPAAIVAEILPGFGEARNYEIELDREKAIALALRRAQPGDAVLIAGKGHERVQEIGRNVIPFDDREVARRILSEMEREKAS